MLLQLATSLSVMKFTQLALPFPRGYVHVRIGFMGYIQIPKEDQKLRGGAHAGLCIYGLSKYGHLGFGVQSRLSQ